MSETLRAHIISQESGVLRVTEKLNGLTTKNEELDNDEEIIAIQRMITIEFY